MASENKSFYTKEGTATGTPTALSTTNPERYDAWKIFNDHASVSLTFVIKGQTVTVKAGECETFSIEESPNNILISGNTATYRIRALGR